MLWSLIKVILFVAIVAALALGAGWLLEAPGGLRVAFAGIELNLGPLQAVIALIVLLLAAWLILKLLGFLVALIRFINGDDTALSGWFDRRRERKGVDALEAGLMSLASGEPRTALSHASKAQRYLDRPALTDLLIAQAAEMAGDRRRAEATYKSLLGDERTRFVGIRGLMRQRLAAGDTDTALKLAERAFALRPRHEEVQDTLLRLQTERGDWGAARRTLAAKLRAGTLPRDVHKRRDAVLALSEARAVIDDDSSIETREAAIEANRLSPDLVPAAVMAARGYIAQGKPRYATRVLRKAWEAQPHPDLAAAYAEIAPDETPKARLKRFGPLLAIHPVASETRMLEAELLIAAEDFPAARRAMGDLATRRPTARSLSLMAAIERGEGADDAVVRAWLARAVGAPRGPQWICDNCHNIHAEWVPVCENCGAFDTLAWREPARGEASASAAVAGAGMLPLIVGEGGGRLPAEAEPAPEAAQGAPSEPEPQAPAEPEVIEVEGGPPPQR